MSCTQLLYISLDAQALALRCGCDVMAPLGDCSFEPGPKGPDYCGVEDFMVVLQHAHWT